MADAPANDSSEGSNSDMLEESEDELNSKFVFWSSSQANLLVNFIDFSYHLFSR